MNETGIFAYFFTCVIIYSLAFPRIYTDDEVKFRIVGGTEGNKEKFPYVVSLRDIDDHHICGGSLINDEYVVTAAHCATGEMTDSVIIGSTYLDKVETRARSLYGHVHPDYDKRTLVHDIAVLQIDKQTSYNSSFPVRLRTNFSDYENPCYAMGWGWTKPQPPSSNIFKIAVVQPVKPKKCEEEWKRAYYPHLICTNSTGDAVCRGDSGGPLICDNKLTGVVSFAKLCGTGRPDAFTAISFYNDWIDSIINQ